MDEELKKKALIYHADTRAGKTEVVPTKPFGTVEELSLAYTPGVAAPVKEIDKERWKAYRYTNKGNLVAVISNGSAVLGEGNVGALASKPVMEGKAMLFKIFADIDAFDIETSDEKPENIISTIQAIAPTFGGINLEDIKAPECFYIEERLRTLLDIPVLHDDQHGTAVIIAAALMNACELASKSIAGIKVVICGAGAAGISTARMLLHIGVPKEHITMVDSKGVINSSRQELSDLKRKFATEATIATLSQAMINADVFIGVSSGELLRDHDLEVMNDSPIIFALANPTPEIDYSHARAVRSDAIMATGRTDLPNQVNNAIAYPYIFRGALDTLSTTINEPMLIAAAKAIAAIAREPAPKVIEERYGTRFEFGKEYILPKMGDPRLLTEVSQAVARAAMESGVARRRIASFSEYRDCLEARIAQTLSRCSTELRHPCQTRSNSGNNNRLNEV
ncbi:MAG: malate dehydrogenase [Bacteroidaceae bacterium]|nr:malate dehydrogenase [Bacteroidaceae bacterium]